MTDRRVVKMRVDYLQSMFVNMRLLTKIDEAKCLELFGITKAQALENMVAGLERTMNGELAKKAKKKADEPMRLCERHVLTHGLPLQEG